MAEQVAPANAPPPSIEARIAATRAPEPAPVADDAPPVDVAPDAPQTDVADGGDAPVADSAGAPSEEPSADAEVGEPSESVEVSTIGDLATHLGVEAADLYDLVLPVSQGESRVDMTLGELKDAAQTYRAAETQREEVAAQKQQLEQEQEQFRASRDQSLREAAALVGAAEQQLIADIRAIDWGALREDNPAEWTAKRQEFGERQQAIENVKAQASATYAQLSEQEQAARQQHAEQLLAREREALLTALPEWRDEEAAQREMADIRTYLTKTGFAEAEINQAADHRAIVMARKAMLYDKQQQAADTVKKRVVKIGKKHIRPGAPRSQTTARNDKIAAARSQLAKSHNVNDAAAAIAAIRKG